MLNAQPIWVNAVILQDICNTGNTGRAVRDTFDDNTQPDQLFCEDSIGLTLKSHSVS